jgi:glycerol-3-phosphate dehydrogenase
MSDPRPQPDFDVVVIGGGVVGCAVARELSGLRMSVALIEARGDIGDATSKANTAILHTGFDCVPGSLESEFVARGYRLLGDYSASAGIPVEATGALLVAWSQEELGILPKLAAKAAENGYHACEIVDSAAVYEAVPELGPGALGGLTVPGESIICSWTTALAYAIEAKARGCSLFLETAVTGVRIGDEHTTLETTKGEVQARWVVNAAGLGGDTIDRCFGFDRFTIVPRRGELLVFDKLSRSKAPCIVLPVPSSKGKGVLVSPTIYGNVMLGPTSENLTDRGDTSTTEEGFAFLLGKGSTLMPSLLEEDVTAAYAGLRASTEHSDYVIDVSADKRYILLGGIRSTGLTASMALAEHVRALLEEHGVAPGVRNDLPETPRMPNIGEAFTRPYEREDLIAADPLYGRVVCFCERVTAGEIRDAMHSPIPPCDVDGLRRRTRALMGRCQGFFCGAEVEVLMRDERVPTPGEAVHG